MDILLVEGTHSNRPHPHPDARFRSSFHSQAFSAVLSLTQKSRNLPGGDWGSSLDVPSVPSVSLMWRPVICECKSVALLFFSDTKRSTEYRVQNTQRQGWRCRVYLYRPGCVVDIRFQGNNPAALDWFHGSNWPANVIYTRTWYGQPGSDVNHHRFILITTPRFYITVPIVYVRGRCSRQRRVWLLDSC